MSEEKEIRRGKLAGVFGKEIVLTNKRLKIGERQDISLSDIQEAYTKTKRGLGGTWSELAIRLRNGEEQTFTIRMEKGIGIEGLPQTQSDQINNAQMLNKSTQDRWVNLISKLLTNKQG